MKRSKFIVYSLILLGLSVLSSCASTYPSSYLWKKDFDTLEKRVLENPDFARRKYCRKHYCSYYGYYSLTDLLATYNYKGEAKDGELLKFLLQNGAELENKSFTSYYIDPLRRALNARRNHIAGILIDAGANIEDVDYMKNTALMIAVQIKNNKDIIEYLIKKGADINATNSMGNTVLEKAVNVAHNSENIEILLKNGADYKFKNDIIIYPEYLSNLKVLLKYNISIISNNNYDYKGGDLTLLHKIMKDYISPLNAELTLEGNDYFRTIHKLILLDNFPVAKKAINLCLLKEPDCKSFLNSYSYFGVSPIMMAIAKNNDELLKFLLCKGADVNKQNKFGETALHIAVLLKKERAVEILLKYGADAELKDINGNTAKKLYMEQFGTLMPVFQKIENKCSLIENNNQLQKNKKEKIIDLTPSEVQNNKN